MENLNLSNEIEYIYKNFKEVVHELFQNESLKLDTIISNREEIFENILLWQKEYLLRADKIILFGYGTWNLVVNISDFDFIDTLDLRNYLLKTLLVDIFKEEDPFYFKEEEDTDIYNYLDLTFRNIVEYFACYDISHKDLMYDLEYNYRSSLSSYKHWKEEHRHHKHDANTIIQTEATYKEYLQYLNEVKSFKDVQIVRVNKLGESENNNDYETQTSMYFIIHEKKLTLLTLSNLT